MNSSVYKHSSNVPLTVTKELNVWTKIDVHSHVITVKVSDLERRDI